jgi:uracil permease
MDLSPVREAPIWAAPVLVAPVLNWQFDLEMVLITMSVVLMEHIAHLKATSQIVGIDYMPRTSRSLIADGLANALSWFGTPSVTYAEIIGLLSMVKDFSLRVIKVAAVLSIIGGFSGKLPFLVLAIPQPVLGGALVLLLGMISTAGLRVLAEIDLNERKNQILSAVMLTMLIIVVVVPLPLPALVVLAFAGIATHLVIDWRAVLNEFRQPQEIELVPAAK